jgi:hypothetical protein
LFNIRAKTGALAEYIEIDMRAPWVLPEFRSAL